MIAFALYFLTCFGIAYIVGHSTISLPVRIFIGGGGNGDPTRVDFTKPLFPGGAWLIALLECPACLGFWLGLFAALLHYRFAPDADPFTLGLATSGANFLLGRLTRLI